MGSDRERITLIFDGAHWKSEDPNITFKAGTKLTAEIDLLNRKRPVITL